MFCSTTSMVNFEFVSWEPKLSEVVTPSPCIPASNSSHLTVVPVPDALSGMQMSSPSRIKMCSSSKNFMVSSTLTVTVSMQLS